MSVPFSILNESDLHNSLKTYYAITNNGQTEVKTDGHIYDIVTDKNEIIEIQTHNISKLRNKIMDVLSKNKKIKIVYPLIISSTIYLTDENGNLISKRKSPKKGCCLDILKEITGITDILLHPDFTLEIAEVMISEHRIKTEQPSQNKTNTRRFRKNWVTSNKNLDEIISTKQLKTKEDYLNLLPSGLPEEFSTKDIKQAFLQEKSFSKKQLNKANLLVWVLRNMKLIEIVKKEGNSIIYKII